MKHLLLSAIASLAFATPLMANENTLTCERLPKNAGVIDAQSYLLTIDGKALIFPITTHSFFKSRSSGVEINIYNHGGYVTSMYIADTNVRDVASLLANC